MEHKFYNRDLSWISFNYRVLMEAKKEDVPLLERLRFIAIYSSNLDEFFRVRVASLRSIQEIDKKKITQSVGLEKNLIQQIHKEIAEQLTDYGQTLGVILEELKAKGLHIGYSPDDLGSSQKDALLQYFQTKVMAYLRPCVFGVSKGDPFLDNQQLYLALTLEKEGEKRFGYVNIPSNYLPRFEMIKAEDESYLFIYLDDIVRTYIDLIFPGYTVLECKSIKLNKDAELNIDDEFSGDLAKKIEKQIKKRNLGTPSRFLYDSAMSEELRLAFEGTFSLNKEDLVAGGRYHNLNDYFQIGNPTRHHLEYVRQKPILHKGIEAEGSMLKAMEKGDRLLHFPYQSYDYTLRFFNEAAIDPEVKEIYVTFYRMASSSVIGEALISAANNGKKVVVFVELKARFDEENNLIWASRMENAGIKIIYSIPGLKVHAKVALVRKKKISYGFFGTGNLNEKTAKIYSDFGLFSCHEGMTGELLKVFKFLHKRKEPGSFNHLLVSQFNALDGFRSLIDTEIENAKAGKKAKIVVKVNNLEEKEMITKLYVAAEAGVEVKVLARSICCLVPETSGIEVIRVVDRYLEHARIFYFENSGEPKVYFGSSDWMRRNLHHRVEVCFPLEDEAVKARAIEILNLHINDNTNAVKLSPTLENKPIVSEEPKVNAQADSYELLKSWHT